MTKKSEPEAGPFELGTMLGQRRAFSVVAGKCSAADVACLRKIRDEKLYRAAGLDWAGFCRKHAGIGKSHADALIRRLEEFGANYFHLSQLVRISADSYRAIAGAVRAEGIEAGSETIAIVPENGPKLAEVVAVLKQRAARRTRPAPNPAAAGKRLAAIVRAIEAVLACDMNEGDRRELRNVLSEAGHKLIDLASSM